MGSSGGCSCERKNKKAVTTWIHLSHGSTAIEREREQRERRWAEPEDTGRASAQGAIEALRATLNDGSRAKRRWNGTTQSMRRPANFTKLKTKSPSKGSMSVVPHTLREKRHVSQDRMVELEEAVKNCTKNELMN